MISLKKKASEALLISSSLILVCTCLLVPLVEGMFSWHLPLYSVIMMFTTFALWFLYSTSRNKGFITPVGFFILSVSVFILARPYLYFFFDLEIVEIGYGINFYNILISISYVAAGLTLIIWGYISCKPGRLKIHTVVTKKIELNRCITFPIILLSIFLLLYFLFRSYSNFLTLKTISYASAFELGTFHNHLIYFFMAKHLVLLWVFFSRHKYNFLLGSFLLFVGSIGFVLIGLRGYTVAYLFLFLYFVNERKKINTFFLAFLSLALIFVAALVLEFRVGFKIFDGFLDVIPRTLHQQGASFEVVFGAAVFPSELRSCISIYEYFSGKDFGACVDQVRGIDWEFGGFASSFFAEAIYFGYIPYALICLALGFCLKYLDHLSLLRRSALANGINSQFIGLILFATLPNLVYFGRSSAFDLIVKVFTVSVILCLFVAIFAKTTKAFTKNQTI